MRRRDWTMTVELRCGVSRARKSTSVNNLTDVEATSLTKRAEAAVAETPDATNVAIAKRIGVSEMTVRRARKSTGDTNVSDVETPSRTKRAKRFLLWSGAPLQSNVASYYVAQAGADLGAGRSRPHPLRPDHPRRRRHGRCGQFCGPLIEVNVDRLPGSGGIDQTRPRTPLGVLGYVQSGGSAGRACTGSRAARWRAVRSTQVATNSRI